MNGASCSPYRAWHEEVGKLWLLPREKPAQGEGLTDKAASFALQGAAEEAGVGEGAGWCHRAGSQSLRTGPCPDRDGCGPGTRSGVEEQRAGEPGGAPRARSGAEQGEEGWLEADAGLAEEEWEEEQPLAGPWRAREEEEVGEGVVAEEECWSCGLLSLLGIQVCCQRNLNWS